MRLRRLWQEKRRPDPFQIREVVFSEHLVKSRAAIQLEIVGVQHPPLNHDRRDKYDDVVFVFCPVDVVLDVCYVQKAWPPLAS